MEKSNSIINRILKSGLITWVLLLFIWGVGALFYTDDFLPNPLVTLDGAKTLITSGTLWTDIVVSMGRVLKGWSLGLLFAIPVGLCVGNFKVISYVFEPFLNFFRF